MTSSTSPTWPPASGLTTVLVPLKDSVFTTSASAHIHAPAARVFDILRNTASYPAWNSFCPKVTIHSQPDACNPTDSSLHKGTSFSFTVVMDPAKPASTTSIQLRVSDLSTPAHPSSYIPADASFTRDLATVYRIAWTAEGSFVARGLRSERFHEVIVRGVDECEVRTWENQGGVLARTVKWLYGARLKRRFQDWCDDLKRVAEEGVVAGADAEAGGE